MFPPSASRIISPLESSVIFVPSFVIVSSAIEPTLEISKSPKSKAPATVSVPEISTLALMSSVVAFNSISVSEVKSNTPSASCLINVPESPNCNCLEEFNSKPVSAT